MLNLDCITLHKFTPVKGFFWRHVGPFSFNKPVPYKARFGACFWGTHFGGSPQSGLAHPSTFYEELNDPLAQVLGRLCLT